MIRLITSIVFLLICSTVYAGDNLPYIVSFDGRWEPAEEPFLINEGGFQDIQNMRRNGRGYSGVKGHTEINTTAWDSTIKYSENGFHFKKDQPAESHFMVSARDSSGATPTIYVNITAIPSAGDFSGTTLYTADTSAGLARFSNAPQGVMAYSNGVETKVYGGNEAKILGFEVYDPLGDFRYDYYDQVVSSLATSGNRATITPADVEIDSNVKLMLHCDGTAGTTNVIDSSSSAHTMTSNGPSHATANKYFGTASLFFNGANQYVTAPDSADWDIGSGAFTIDLWAYRELSQNQSLISHTSGTTIDFFIDSNDKLNFEYYAAGGTIPEVDLSTGDSILVNSWTHVAVTRDGSDNWGLWIDGSLRDYSSGSTTINDAAGTLVIGSLLKSGVTPINSFQGYIDEVRFTKGEALFLKDFEVAVSAYSENTKAFMLIGCPVPATGFKLYIQNANDQASTMKVFRWAYSDWSEVSGLSDGTSSGTTSLYQTGSVSWTAETPEEKKINSLLDLYWYKVEISDCNSNTRISQITHTFPFSNLTNIWDSDTSPIISAYVYTNGFYNDYSLEVQTNTTDGVMPMDSLSANEYIILGFASRQQAFNFNITADKGNANEAYLTVSYWSGTTWSSVLNLKDGTTTNAAPLSSSGLVSFDEVAEATEFKTEIDKNIPLYFYKLEWGSTFDAETEVYYIEGIPVQDSLNSYKFTETFQNRLFLFGENNLDKNMADYSAFNTYYIFNGDDSGSLHFGNDEEITASTVLYNLYDTQGFEQMVVTKQNETYTVFGDDPTNWTVVKMSDHIGCVAPLSMALCEITGISETNKKNVAIWQSSSGIFLCDGANIIDISHDIRNYFDSNDSTFIPVDRQDDSVGWYDPNIKSYRLFISSGSGQADHNVELEYSLKYGEWTKIYRENVSGANPLQAGFNVRATNGATYSYGATDEGTVYRLENTNKWDTTNINQFIQTKNLLLEASNPLLNHTSIAYVRTFFKDKDSSSGSMSIAHYSDDILTVEDEDNNSYDIIDDINLNSGPWDTQSCTLGPALFHSFKISSTASDVADGLELYGISLYYNRYDSIYDE